MSANEIELTFIRCPSCKSLMPSTAVKCGMCGFDLGGEEDSFQPQQQEKKSRIRQNTFSGPIDDFAAPSVDSRENNDSSYFNPHAHIFNEPVEEPEYHEAIHREVAKQDSYVSPTSTQKYNEESQPKDREKSFFTQDERSARFDYPESSTDFDDLDSDDDSDEDEEVLDSVTERSRVQHAGGDEVDEENPVKKKRRRKRKKKKTTPQEDQAQSEATVESYESDAISAGKSVVVENSSNEVSRASFVEAKPLMTQREKPVERESFRLTEKTSTQQTSLSSTNNRATQSSQTSHKVVSASVSTQKIKGESEMLVGWFVNYSTNKKGTSFEIRLGRQFVGRQSLREDDLIIQDSAISTPHCLLQVDTYGNVMLQDLMSENGTFVKKTGESDFVQVDSSIELQHGDRVRLGSYEMVVCLIPN